MDAPELPTQYYTFKDCLARQIIARSPSDSSSDVDDAQLDDFSSFLASEVWDILPSTLRDASYETRATVPDLETMSLDNVPPSFSDTLTSYALCPDDDGAETFLRRVLSSYAADVTAPPPPWPSTRTKECELCERDVPLTYHHLIPRSTHAKVLKRKWHPESMINSVAWLCRPCHTAVHRFARTDELARNYYTMQLLLERDEIQRWKSYAAKQRYGVKRG
ncbi:hypothetical protein BV25DRAFT_1867886 [Artomyces pyxidatus]|uniref:Uncharacterized protein n=1 Tax=Artomyces pyxidatus TaxID=48021 RepID=A0ACB8TG94_9AGAM|nr:hypothetical protein BV25DRAFT_1867886 [Artomyces pyxidatus]